MKTDWSVEPQGRNENTRPVASSVRVVPVSTIPAVVERIVWLVPYTTDWSIPQNSDAGEVLVRGLIQNSGQS